MLLFLALLSFLSCILLPVPFLMFLSALMPQDTWTQDTLIWADTQVPPDIDFLFKALLLLGCILIALLISAEFFPD